MTIADTAINEFSNLNPNGFIGDSIDYLGKGLDLAQGLLAVTLRLDK
jgi:hypothetical protein